MRTCLLVEEAAVLGGGWLHIDRYASSASPYHMAEGTYCTFGSEFHRRRKSPLVLCLALS